MIGKTIKKDITIDKFLLPNQRITSITKLATGVDFTKLISGFRRNLIVAKRYERIARIIPNKLANRKPEVIRKTL
jgi:hypothetical protein